MSSYKLKIVFTAKSNRLIYSPCRLSVQLIRLKRTVTSAEFANAPVCGTLGARYTGSIDIKFSTIKQWEKAEDRVKVKAQVKVKVQAKELR